MSYESTLIAAYVMAVLTFMCAGAGTCYVLFIVYRCCCRRARRRRNVTPVTSAREEEVIVEDSMTEDSDEFDTLKLKNDANKIPA